MNRPVSPLLHDYKSSATTQVKKSTAIHWFVLGLGLPFLGLGLLLFLKNASGTSSVLDNKDLSEPLPSLAGDVPSLVRNLNDELAMIELSHSARLPELEPRDMTQSGQSIGRQRNFSILRSYLNSCETGLQTTS